MSEKVVLGLSGGVDSAVCAHLLKRAGYELYGLYLDNGFPGAASALECAEALDLPLVIRDVTREMEKEVCAPFAESYLRGETPNPCILCNPSVKLRALEEEADRLGAAWIATGHYAVRREGRLLRGRPENDQSYMLCRITEGQLARLLLPLGEYTKSEVRALAEKLGLPAARKPDSMEICFIPDGDYAGWIERRGIVPPPGEFFLGGRCVGQHRGIYRYTIGQRRHFGQGFGQRVYVSGIDPAANRVILSSDESALRRSTVCVRDIRWLRVPEEGAEYGVRLRHSRGVLPVGTVQLSGTGAVISFSSPVRAPTPGQTAAFYDGEELLGGGFITR